MPGYPAPENELTGDKRLIFEFIFKKLVWEDNDPDDNDDAGNHYFYNCVREARDFETAAGTLAMHYWNELPTPDRIRRAAPAALRAYVLWVNEDPKRVNLQGPVVEI